MEPSGVIDDSFRNLFDKVASIIHEQEDFEKAHETLDEHYPSNSIQTVNQTTLSRRVDELFGENDTE